MSNELSIYREVLRFRCNVLDLQEKLDSLIVMLRMSGYSVKCQRSSLSESVRISFFKDEWIKLVLYFYYDNERKYIERFKYYHETNDDFERWTYDLGEINEIEKELDRFAEIM